VLIRTGWIETMLADPHYYDGEPGIDVEAGRWLAEAGVAVIGSDNFAVEHIPFPQGSVFPVHQLVIRNYGIPLLEGLVLAPLAAKGVSEFLFIATPLPFIGGTGSPLVPVAIL
jgi:kynurenine formamidase